MARLQQLYLQLRIQRPPGDPGEEESTRAPLPSPLHTPGNGGQVPWELLSQTEQTGEGPSCLPLPCLPGVPPAGPLSRSLMGCLLALANLTVFLKGQRLLHPQRWRCPVPTLPGCQKPQWSQRTTCHLPRDTGGISPTGTRSRSCSTGS
ncbi:C8orf58 isoform 7, partial [Pongo abelii]